jgi:hypothetical protein
LDGKKIVEFYTTRSLDEKNSVFSFVDCYEFSKFCKVNQKIFSYPTYHVYSRSEIKKVLNNLPNEKVIEELIQK